jgi:biopolymer transport protein ExbD
MPNQSQRSSKLFSGIDATAFASILVVLLFVVLIAEGMTYNPHHGVSADLPKVMHPVPMPGALREDGMQVCIMRDGKVYFGVERIDAFALQAKVEDRLRDRGVERKVYIIVDQRARWGTVKQVLDAVRSAGVIRVAFLVDQRRGPIPMR